MFSLGQVVAIKSVLELLINSQISMFLSRHANDGWGDLDQEDKTLNDHTL